MRKLILIAIAAASYYIAGMYRQMPLMILAVMEWLLLVFLIFFPRCLRRNTMLSFPMQNSEAEKGSEKNCIVRIERTGVFPLKKVCVMLRVYDDEGTLIQKIKVQKSIGALTGTIDFGIVCSQCGLLNVQIDKVLLYDYLSAFSVAKTIHAQMKVVVLPKARELPIQSSLVKSAVDRQEEFQYRSSVGRFGDESKELRQIREYHIGDTMRYVHWNQSAKTGKLWFKEFEREEEDALEILLDMQIPENWKHKERDGFYEVVSAILLGLLRVGYCANVCWYNDVRHDDKGSGFVTLRVENRTDYRSLMRRLYQSAFVEKTDAVEKAYQKKQAAAYQSLLKVNLLLECYEIREGYREELRHRFTYEDLEKELSGDYIFSLR